LLNEKNITSILSFMQDRRRFLKEEDFSMLSLVHRYKFKDLWPSDFSTIETYRESPQKRKEMTQSNQRSNKYPISLTL